MLLDFAIAELNKVYNEKRDLLREIRDREPKHKVCELEKYFIQEEVNELKVKIKSFEKSSSHNIVKSNLSTSSTKSPKKFDSGIAMYDNRYYKYEGSQWSTKYNKSTKESIQNHNTYHN